MRNRSVLVAAGLLGLLPAAHAQLKVGATGAPNADAMLEIASGTGANKGMMLPTVQLTSTSLPAPMSAHVRGMMVVNLAAAGSGSTAVIANTVYYNTGTQWTPAGNTVGGAATYTANTLACGGALSGIYRQTVAMNSGNTKAVTITALGTGTYTATTNTQNGVSFAASGTLVSTGANTQVILQASGTPTAVGTFTYTVNLGGQTCSFSVTYVDDAIRAALASAGCASCGAYDGAAIDEAVSITAAEYNAIATAVSNADRYGVATSVMNGTPNSSSHFVFPTSISANVSTGGLPQNGYVCAIWTKSGTVQAAGDYWYFANSTGASPTCANIRWKAGNLGTQSGNTNCYWAIKRPSTANPNANGAILTGQGISPNLFGTGYPVSNAYYSNIGSTCSPPAAASAYPYVGGLQSISTTAKQW
jgi:hypothetical protein